MPKIEHIVVVMMENHSFDDDFGMLGRGDGFKLDAQRAAARRQPDGDGQLRAARSTCRRRASCRAHPARTGSRVTRRSNDGRNDGFVQGERTASRWATGTRPTFPSTTALAKTFPLCDRYFCSVLAQTYPNRRFLIAGTAAGIVSTSTSKRSPVRRRRTARSSIASHAHDISGSNYYTDLPGIAVIARRPRAKYAKHLVKIDQFYTDAAAGTLPSVSFVDPELRADRESEENPRRHPRRRERSSAKVINAVMQSPNVGEARVLIYTYDEHGGYYDHVPPPPAIKPDNIAPGADVPGITGALRPLRLPRADGRSCRRSRRRDYVSHVVHDHTSILKLIETKWNLGALTYRDANAEQPARLARPRRRRPRSSSRRRCPPPGKPGTCTPGNPGGPIPPAGRGRAREPGVVASDRRDGVALVRHDAVDVRTRVDGPRTELDPDAVLRAELPAAIDAHADCDRARARVRRGPGRSSSRSTATRGRSRADDGRVDDHARRRRRRRRARAARPREQLADLVDDQQTFMSLWAVERARPDEAATSVICLDWWLVWRAALDGTPIYTPGSVTFDDRDGGRSISTRTFRPDDDPDEMRHFLEKAGFLHIAGAVHRRRDGRGLGRHGRAVPTYTEGDGRSWWARTADGDDAPRAHAGLRPRVRHACARSLDDDAVPLDSRRSPAPATSSARKRANNRIEALFKPIGVTEGISDIPWHKDCGIGRHSYDCCGLTVGISVTGADDVSGQLRALAGSHRALVWSGIRQPDLDLPDVPLADRHRRRHAAPELHDAHGATAGRTRAPRDVQRLLAPAARDAPTPTRSRRGARPARRRARRRTAHRSRPALQELGTARTCSSSIRSTSTRFTRSRCRCVTSRRSDRNVYDRCIYQGVDHEADDVLHHRARRVPEPRRDRRVRDRAPRRQAVGDPHVGRASRRQDEPAGRAVPHRGRSSRSTSCGSSATPTTTASASTSCTARSTGRSPNRSTSAARAIASCSTRRASRASARGKASCASTARRSRSRPTATPRRATARGASVPSAKPEPAGRPNEFTGMWWCWIPLRFDDFALHVILEEDRDGLRNTNFAVRVWPAATGHAARATRLAAPRDPLHVGHAQSDRTRRSTSRTATARRRRSRSSRSSASRSTSAAATAPTPTGRTACGRATTGSRARVYDYNDPAVTGRAAFSLWDHIARATFDGHEGYGIFEHGCIGPHAPSGFTDFADGAP